MVRPEVPGISQADGSGSEFELAVLTSDQEVRKKKRAWKSPLMAVLEICFRLQPTLWGFTWGSGNFFPSFYK